MTANQALQWKQRARAVTLSAWMLLLLLVAGKQLFQGLNLAQWLWALVFSLPLLAPLRGLWRGERYTYAWATLCVLPYFIIGISESVASPTLRIWAEWLLAASLLWFFALIAFLRFSRPRPVEVLPT